MAVAIFRTSSKHKQALGKAEYTRDQEQGIEGMQGKEPSHNLLVH